jgi:hypothetical protein
MSGKPIETDQVRVYMKARELGLTQADAASIAEFSERSGQGSGIDCCAIFNGVRLFWYKKRQEYHQLWNTNFVSSSRKSLSPVKR